MRNSPPLLLFAELNSEFSLEDLIFEQGRDSENAVQLHKKKSGASLFESVEVIYNGLTFAISLFRAEDLETLEKEGSPFTCLECKKPALGMSAIGISLGQHISAGFNVPIVNMALLETGRIIGQSVLASHTAWIPARQFTSFAYYSEAVQHYTNGGPLPALVQIRIEKDSLGDFTTSGLHYFAKQELLVTGNCGLQDNEIVQRLVRIARDVAVNGPILKDQDVKGMDDGEIVRFRPSDDAKTVRAEISWSRSPSLN